jgi:hypothetical protein
MLAPELFTASGSAALKGPDALRHRGLILRTQQTKWMPSMGPPRNRLLGVSGGGVDGVRCRHIMVSALLFLESPSLIGSLGGVSREQNGGPQAASWRASCVVVTR